MQRDLFEALRARAKEIGTSACVVILAALHVGLQRLRPSDVAAMEHRYRGLVSWPTRELLKRGLVKYRRDPNTGHIIGWEPVQRSA
jgi:hypothetical protein